MRITGLYAICVVIVAGMAVLALVHSKEAIEVMSIELFPNAQRAFSYGEAHFDAQNPSEYDINLADYFFKKARAIGPAPAYLYHEMARISFLRGNFNQAIGEINTQILLHGDETPNSYYIRGLIEGYMGEYNASIEDYKHFLQFDSNDWAAMNDYAWVLLKANRPQDAAIVTTEGLKVFPENPWLLNTNATALYEMNAFEAAYAKAKAAVTAAQLLTPAQWLHAYPGNDPAIAAGGIATFQKATQDNMHSIEAKLASTTVQ